MSVVCVSGGGDWREGEGVFLTQVGGNGGVGRRGGGVVEGGGGRGVNLISSTHLSRSGKNLSRS